MSTPRRGDDREDTPMLGKPSPDEDEEEDDPEEPMLGKPSPKEGNPLLLAKRPPLSNSPLEKVLL